MGCSGSKDKKPKDKKDKKEDAAAADNAAAQPQDAHNNDLNAANHENSTTMNSDAKAQKVEDSNVRRAVDAPAGRAANDDHLGNTDVASSAAPRRGPAKSGDAASVDENGNPVVLPKGDWVHTEGTPYYYSATENLYYHPPSCQFYDPTNEMWYDPEKDEWYRDDEEDNGAAA